MKWRSSGLLLCIFIPLALYHHLGPRTPPALTPAAAQALADEPTLGQSPSPSAKGAMGPAIEFAPARRHPIPLQAHDVLKAIQHRNGEPPPGYVGGRVFLNRERRLPDGRYREYDVHPKQAGKIRGAERIVIEQRTGKAYYTGDHYRTFLPMN